MQKIPANASTPRHFSHALIAFFFARVRLRPQREARRFESYGYAAESGGSTDVVQTADK